MSEWNQDSNRWENIKQITRDLWLLFVHLGLCMLQTNISHNLALIQFGFNSIDEMIFNVRGEVIRWDVRLYLFLHPQWKIIVRRKPSRTLTASILPPSRKWFRMFSSYMANTNYVTSLKPAERWCQLNTLSQNEANIKNSGVASNKWTNESIVVVQASNLPFNSRYERLRKEASRDKQRV